MIKSISITVKNKLINEKIIIFLIIFFLLASFSFIFYYEKKQQSPLADNMWEVYFENPKSQELTFSIKNNGKRVLFVH